MPAIKFEFPNDLGEQLSGRLEMPPDSRPVAAYALFAHCFTCGKDSSAASRISRALAARGIAVLRFDFTGLGNSEGDFGNSNFSSNVEDLLSAARELERVYSAPSLLIGHSLGGAAVLMAAAKLPAVRAVVTIGAPANARHLGHLFKESRATIEAEGQAQVMLGSGQFTVKKQLLDDLECYAEPGHIRELGKALLVFHAPLDDVVSIDEAATLYQAARHPKSFISLDRADHLLTNKADAQYVADTTAAWASRYLDISEDNAVRWQGEPPEVAAGDVVVSHEQHKFLSGLHTDAHHLLADEPRDYGGLNLGPTPYDLLLMALGACTSMTLRMYAARKGLPLEDVQVTLRHERVHASDCEECGEREGKVERISRIISLQGELSESQRQRLVEIADRCPVHRTLESDPVVTTQLVPQ